MNEQWYWIENNAAIAVEIVDEASLTVKRSDTAQVFVPSMAKLFTMSSIERANKTRKNKITVK